MPVVFSYDFNQLTNSNLTICIFIDHPEEDLINPRAIDKKSPHK